MRVLIVTVAEKTNFLNMVPLGWALRACGHDVLVASQPELGPVASGTGLPYTSVGRDHGFWRIMRLSRPAGAPSVDVPLFQGLEEPFEEISWDRLLGGYREVVPWWWRTVNDPMLEDLVALCRRWRPDLVLWEPIAFAAPIAAEATGAVHARFLWGVDLLGGMREAYLRAMDAQPEGERRDPLGEWMGRHAARWGVEFRERMTRGYFTLDYLPEPLRLQDAPGVRYVPLRYIPYNGRAVVPDWLLTPPERPRVCLTLGTSATERQGGYSVPVKDILESLADLDAEIVATLPDAERAHLGTLPPNVRPIGFTPLEPLARTCSAVINHGGWGTFLGVASLGVPQIVVPTWFDNVLPARRLEALGAGVHIPPERADGSRVRGALTRLLNEPAPTGAARRLRTQMESSPSPNTIASRMESLVADHRTR